MRLQRKVRESRGIVAVVTSDFQTMPTALASGSIPPGVVDLPAWYSKIIVNDAGRPHSGAAARNAEIALTEDPVFAGAIRYDALRGQTMVHEGWFAPTGLNGRRRFC